MTAIIAGRPKVTYPLERKGNGLNSGVIAGVCPDLRVRVAKDHWLGSRG
jgi:hypothetical protein